MEHHLYYINFPANGHDSTSDDEPYSGRIDASNRVTTTHVSHDVEGDPTGHTIADIIREFGSIFQGLGGPQTTVNERADEGDPASDEELGAVGGAARSTVRNTQGTIA